MKVKQKTIYDWFKNSLDDALKILTEFEKSDKVTPDIRRSVRALTESASDNTNESIEYDRQIIRVIDNDIISSAEDFFQHLRILAAATDNEPGLEVYDEDAIADILSGYKKEYDELRYIHTLRQSINAENRHNIALLLLVNLEKIDLTAPLSATDAIIRALQFDILWADFLNLPEEGLELLFTSFIYQSIVMNAPVEARIKYALYITTSSAEYFFLCQKYYEYLLANKEQVLLSTDGKLIESFAAITLTLSDRVGEKSVEQSEIDSFVAEIYVNDPKFAHLRAWLSKTLAIYFAIKEARIIDKTLGGETSEADMYENDMKQLFEYFFDPKTWPKIVEYFKKPKQLVSIENFLDAFPKSCDLNKEATIRVLADFSRFLHADRLLPHNKEIIEFHEKDGRFYWNEELL